MLRSRRLALLLVALLPTLLAGRCAHGGDAVDDPLPTDDLEEAKPDSASAPGHGDTDAPGGGGSDVDANVPIPELDPELEATFEPTPTPDAPPDLPGAGAGVDPTTDFGVPAGVPPINDPGPADGDFLTPEPRGGEVGGEPDDLGAP